MQFGLLGDERQAQPGARARRRRPAGEPFEDRTAFRFRDPGAVVVDRDLHAFAGTATLSWISVAPPCLTALAMALSVTSRSPVGKPTISTVGDGTSDTSTPG